MDIKGWVQDIKCQTRSWLGTIFCVGNGLFDGQFEWRMILHQDRFEEKTSPNQDQRWK